MDVLQLEVCLVFDVPDGPFPGDAIWETAAARCIAAFDPFVGTGYHDSELDFEPMVATAASWSDGDRTVLCSNFSMDGQKLAGTARGLGR